VSGRNERSDAQLEGPRFSLVAGGARAVQSTGKKVGVPFGVAFFGFPVLLTARSDVRQPILVREGMPPPVLPSTPSLFATSFFGRHPFLFGPALGSGGGRARRVRRCAGEQWFGWPPH
jgi:hypothetical protein